MRKDKKAPFGRIAPNSPGRKHVLVEDSGIIQMHRPTRTLRRDRQGDQGEAQGLMDWISFGIGLVFGIVLVLLIVGAWMSTWKMWA